MVASLVTSQITAGLLLRVMEGPLLRVMVPLLLNSTAGMVNLHINNHFRRTEVRMLLLMLTLAQEAC